MNESHIILTEKVFLNDLNKRRGTATAVSFSDVFYIKSHGRKAELILYGDSISIYGSLSGLEKTLQKRKFLRIHRSYLINTSKVYKISGTSVMMKNGDTLPVSRLYLKALYQMIYGMEKGERKHWLALKELRSKKRHQK